MLPLFLAFFDNLDLWQLPRGRGPDLLLGFLLKGRLLKFLLVAFVKSAKLPHKDLLYTNLSKNRQVNKTEKDILIYMAMTSAEAVKFLASTKLLQGVAPNDVVIVDNLLDTVAMHVPASDDFRELGPYVIRIAGMVGDVVRERQLRVVYP